MRGQPLQLFAQRVFVRKELQLSAQLEIVRKELQLSAQLGLKDVSAAECADQNYGFVRSGIKAHFCGRSPYTGGEPRYICVVVLLCGFCYVLMLLISR